jgi:hypothetical protein
VVDPDDSSAITHLGASPIHMYRRKSITIQIMIIHMLVVDPKLHENTLSHCSFISHLHRVALYLSSYFSFLAIIQTPVSLLLGIKGSLVHSFVILARASSIAPGRLSVGSISLFQN